MQFLYQTGQLGRSIHAPPSLVDGVPREAISLLMHFDAVDGSVDDWQDSSIYNHSIAANLASGAAPIIDNPGGKFLGGGRVRATFPFRSNLAVTYHEALDVFGLVDFTVDAWVYYDSTWTGSGTSQPKVCGRADHVNANSNQWYIGLAAGSTTREVELGVYRRNAADGGLSAGVSLITARATGFVLPTDQWVHIRGTRGTTGGQDDLRVYVNGILRGRTTSAKRYINQAWTMSDATVKQPMLVFNSYNDNARNWRGKLDEIRLIKGYALTGNGASIVGQTAFDVPTEPFTNP